MPKWKRRHWVGNVRSSPAPPGANNVAFQQEIESYVASVVTAPSASNDRL